MKKSLLLALTALVLALCGQAKAADFAQTYMPTSGSIVASGSGVWGTTVSSSRVVFQNTAGDQTDTLYFDVTPPSRLGNGVAPQVTKFVVYFNVRVAAIDAAPSFVVRRIYHPATAYTLTSAALTDTESGCTATTVNTSYRCVITVSPYNAELGERLQLEMSINNSATSVVQITGWETRSEGM